MIKWYGTSYSAIDCSPGQSALEYCGSLCGGYPGNCDQADWVWCIDNMVTCCPW